MKRKSGIREVEVSEGFFLPSASWRVLCAEASRIRYLLSAANAKWENLDISGRTTGLGRFNRHFSCMFGALHEKPVLLEHREKKKHFSDQGRCTSF